MYKIHTILLIMVYIILLIFAIHLLGTNFICDDHTCSPMIKAKKHTSKLEQLHLIDHLCAEGIWPFGYIASSILSGLFFSIFPHILNISTYTVVFLVTFLVFYAIMGYFIHHYVVPIKKYIRKYINDNIDDNIDDNIKNNIDGISDSQICVSNDLDDSYS